MSGDGGEDRRRRRRSPARPTPDLRRHAGVRPRAPLRTAPRAVDGPGVGRGGRGGPEGRRVNGAPVPRTPRRSAPVAAPRARRDGVGLRLAPGPRRRRWGSARDTPAPAPPAPPRAAPAPSAAPARLGARGVGVASRYRRAPLGARAWRPPRPAGGGGEAVHSRAAGDASVAGPALERGRSVQGWINRDLQEEALDSR